LEKRVFLKKGDKNRPRWGHPWIYRSQIDRAQGDPAPGDLVEVHATHGIAGVGYFNLSSEISVRLLSSKSVSINEAFFRSRIERALALRRRFMKSAGAFRVIASEADGLPGLIADLYGEVLVVQFLTMGMEKLRPLVLKAFEETLPSLRGIYEKSDSSSRAIEGLAPRVEWIRKDCGDEVQIDEEGIRYAVRLEGGHKTGFYLDQRENRILIGNLGVKGSCLDAFCYEGGFGLHLVRGGAKEVIGIDSQEEAVARAEENRRLNGFSENVVRYRTANVFDALREFEKEKKRFDLIVLDPPSFVKKKAALEGALAGYKEIALRSMKILNDPGLLAVFSCSYHVTDDLLMQVCMSAARDVRKSLKVIRFLKQSPDHPIDPFIPESYYLKGFLLEITSL